MIRYSGLALVGMILLAFGLALGGISYVNLYDIVEKTVPASGWILIPGNSSMNFLYHYLSPSRAPFDSFTQVSKIQVLVSGIKELESLIPPALNINCTLPLGENVTISLYSDFGQSMSASEGAWGIQTYGNPVAFHEFDISNWSTVNLGIRIYNPENYTVCWIVNVVLWGQVINNDWLAVFFIGIVAVILGLAIGIVGYSRRRNN